MKKLSILVMLIMSFLCFSITGCDYSRSNMEAHESNILGEWRAPADSEMYGLIMVFTKNGEFSQYYQGGEQNGEYEAAEEGKSFNMIYEDGDRVIADLSKSSLKITADDGAFELVKFKTTE